MNVKQWFMILGRNFKFYYTYTPNVFCIPHIHLISCLHIFQTMLIKPIFIILLSFLVAIIIFLITVCFLVINKCFYNAINHRIRLKLCFSDILSALGTNLQSYTCKKILTFFLRSHSEMQVSQNECPQEAILHPTI